MESNASSSNKAPLLNESFMAYKTKKAKYYKLQGQSIWYLLCKCLFPCLYSVDHHSERAVFLSESEAKYNLSPYQNKVINTKYNIFTFIPLVIINQFIFFGNQFYLIMTLSQFIDVFKVGFLFSYLAPLLIVIVLSLVKEAIDEIKKSQRDGKINKEKFTKVTYSKSAKKIIRTKINSMDIKVGDYIELRENKRIPADLILLKNLSSEKSLFIKTEQLDGETDWKLRKAPQAIKELSNEEVLNSDCFIVFEPPSKEIYEFKGVIHYSNKNEEAIEEALNLENTLWASTILKSKHVLGIVIYTGKETRIEMNSSKAKSKIGILDFELNYLTKILFGFMVLLSFVIVWFKKTNLLFRCIIFFRFIVLFCGIIPISLRVNLDFSKSFFQYRINNDLNIKGTIVRNSSIIEDLGRISYVFTDKTGTLTKNEMIFQELVTQTNSFSLNSSEQIKTILSDEGSINYYMMSDLNQPTRAKGKKSNMRNENFIIRDSIRVMALCNNVTPFKQKDNTLTYQAASPDEIALVKYAEGMNIKMDSRSDTNIKLINSNNKIEDYDILANFPFSSETKRMGIILHIKKQDKIIFLLKGAESAIVDFVFEEQKGYILEIASDLSKKGLRTLVFAEKVIQKEDYDQWRVEYDQALRSMENRKKNIAQAISRIENKMHFLCVTGVEDKLQLNVMMTIESFRNAGIRIWMLTGDKIETAICISISTGLKAKKHAIYILRLDSELSIEKQLRIFNSKPKDTHILVLDGKVIDKCLTEHEEEFFEVALKAPSVVCCRCSPTQKSQIVSKVKKYIKFNERTCAVGDGGNDVSMIQQADIGIGIVGKEGMQASLSSDFSIEQFTYLSFLFFWYGRNAYKNTATMGKFIIQRGMIISFIQCFFSTLFYFNAIALYNGMLILGYSTVYTTFPSISVLLDIDANEINVVSFPTLYSELQKGRELSLKQFCLLVLQSIFQAAVIMIGSIYIFGDNLYLKIVTVTFTELIFAEILNVFTEIKTFNRWIFISLSGTCMTYLLSILFLKSVLDVYFIFDMNTMQKVFTISLIVWFPFYLFKTIKRCCFPEVYEKIEKIQNVY